MSEVVRLTALVGGGPDLESAAEPAAQWASSAGPAFDHRGFVAEAARLEAQVGELQQRLEAGGRGRRASPPGQGSDIAGS